MYEALELVPEAPLVCMPADDGEMLFAKDDWCEHALEIRSGIARAVSYSRGGDRQVMAFFFPGDIIGLPLFDAHRYSAEAVSGLRFARHPAERYRMGKEHYDQSAQKVAGAVWQEEKAFIARGLILGRVGALSRVAAFLGYLAEHLADEDRTMPFAIPQADIASYLATSPETVCRTLRGLRDRGLIAMTSRDRLKILDPAQLARLAAEGRTCRDVETTRFNSQAMRPKQAGRR